MSRHEGQNSGADRRRFPLPPALAVHRVVVLALLAALLSGCAQTSRGGHRAGPMVDASHVARHIAGSFDDGKLDDRELGDVKLDDGKLERAPAEPAPEGRIEEFVMPSAVLSRFWGRPMQLEAFVRLPAGYDPSVAAATCYVIHGFTFGSNEARAWTRGYLRRIGFEKSSLVCVGLIAQYPMGHHEFADSVNNGPWGTALTQEFIPALEQHYHLANKPQARFLTGHSSGGWSSLWLQVNYPKFFGGCWSTAPDSVDFRNFSGIDLYQDHSCYTDAEGNARPLIRMGGQVRSTFETFARVEQQNQPVGGQLYSFNAVFSPRAADGTPMRMFDPETGKIDREVVNAWKRFDISLILRNRWSQLAPDLQGKLHIYMGTEDNFYLNGATELLAKELRALGSDAEVILVEGRDHSSLVSPHPTHWPTGMTLHILSEMEQAAKK